MNKLKNIIEYPYKKYLQWKHRKNVLTGYTEGRLVNIKYSINIWNIIIFYLVLLGLITVSLAVFIAVFLIIQDIC